MASNSCKSPQQTCRGVISLFPKSINWSSVIHLLKISLPKLFAHREQQVYFATHVCTMLLMIRKFKLTRKAIVVIVFIAVYISVISVSPGWYVWKSRLNSSKHKQRYICHSVDQFMFRISA